MAPHENAHTITHSRKAAPCLPISVCWLDQLAADGYLLLGGGVFVGHDKVLHSDVNIDWHRPSYSDSRGVRMNRVVGLLDVLEPLA